MGELEAAVLAVLWAAETPLTAKRVQDGLPMALARTTVATLLARLHEKGAVVRERAGRGYTYTAAQDRQGLTARRMHRELDKDADREMVLARFVSQLGPDDERILRDLLDAEAAFAGGADTVADTGTNPGSPGPSAEEGPAHHGGGRDDAEAGGRK